MSERTNTEAAIVHYLRAEACSYRLLRSVVAGHKAKAIEEVANRIEAGRYPPVNVDSVPIWSEPDAYD